MEFLLDLGVDGIMTDRPRLLKQVLKPAVCGDDPGALWWDRCCRLIPGCATPAGDEADWYLPDEHLRWLTVGPWRGCMAGR